MALAKATIEIIDPDTGETDTEAALTVQRAALDRGLILEVGGRGDAVVRLLPPLNVSRRTLDQALDILDAQLRPAAEPLDLADDPHRHARAASFDERKLRR